MVYGAQMSCCRPSEVATGWLVIVLTALMMAVSNLMTVFSVEYLVRVKFHLVQLAVDDGVAQGILALVGLMALLALLGAALVHGLAVDAGGSGSPENKAWLNGFEADAKKVFAPRDWAEGRGTYDIR